MVIVRSGNKIRLRVTTGSARTELLVTALEDGAAGDVIRCRSTLGPAILEGRLQADSSAELVWTRPVENRVIESTETRGAW